jgi:MFS transporter, FSR family, fosmidomycin resistance protein
MTSEVASIPESALASSSEPELERSLVLWLTNVSHAVNHFQNQMVAALYPIIMAELGFGYFQLGTITAIRSIFGSGSQVLYGFLTPFISRSHLLGVGNLVLGAGTLLTGAVSGYGPFIGARAVTSIGSSVQHPVGASLLAGYFPRNRGAILALNNSVANVGSLLAPAAAGFLLLVMGWRQIFFVVAIFSLVMGGAYFFFRDRFGSVAKPQSRRARLSQGKASYLRVLRNRNIMVISVVQMVGAAGGDGGVNQTYLGPHLVNDFKLSVAMAGVALSVFQLGTIFGPLWFGWLSDRMSRKAVIQASLFLSCLGTLSLAKQDDILGWLTAFLGQWWPAMDDAFVPLMMLNLLVYGGVTSSRMTLTQALVADSLADTDRDAAFSLYYFIAFLSDPIWALVTGGLMENFGFAFAFSRLSLSYLIGMGLLFLVVDSRRARPSTAG